MSKKIGFLLGSFDPVHIGHLYMATEALNLNLVDKVIFVPAFQNPWKEKSVDFWHRCSMLSSAVAHIPNCSVSEVEKLLNPPYYSYNTLKVLKEQYPNDELYLIVGADVASEIKNWYRGEWILNNYKLLIVRRNGYLYDGHIDIQRTINISSTDLRNMYRNGKQVYPLVPQEIDNYIKKYKIYN